MEIILLNKNIVIYDPASDFGIFLSIEKVSSFSGAIEISNYFADNFYYYYLNFNSKLIKFRTNNEDSCFELNQAASDREKIFLATRKLNHATDMARQLFDSAYLYLINELNTELERRLLFFFFDSFARTHNIFEDSTEARIFEYSKFLESPFDSSQLLELSGRKVIIVAHELKGVTFNGGIGTFNDTLAVLLAQNGCEVTVVFSPLTWWSDYSISEAYYENDSIEFITLNTLPYENISIHPYYSHSKALYELLKIREFDVIYFPEHSGIGCDSIVAHKYLNFKRESHFITVTHGCSRWCEEQNGRSMESFYQLHAEYMENISILCSDTVVSPSKYLLSWYQEHFLKLPNNTSCLPYPLPNAVQSYFVENELSESVCFFGRLEIRKGIDIFCDAVDELLNREFVPPHIIFLGREMRVWEQTSTEYINERASKWNTQVSILNSMDHDQALEFLARENPHVVMPSRGDNSPFCVYEAAGMGLTFCGSNSGGIPEIISETQLLCELDGKSLADKILLMSSHERPKLRFKIEQVEQAWLSLTLSERPQKECTTENTCITLLSNEDCNKVVESNDSLFHAQSNLEYDLNELAYRANSEYLMIIANQLQLNSDRIKFFNLDCDVLLSPTQMFVENWEDSIFEIPYWPLEVFETISSSASVFNCIVKRESFLRAGGFGQVKDNSIADFLYKVRGGMGVCIPESLGKIVSDAKLQKQEIYWSSFTKGQADQARLALFRNACDENLNLDFQAHKIKYFEAKSLDHCRILNITPENLNILTPYVGQSTINEVSEGELNNLVPPFLFILPTLESSKLIAFKIKVKTNNPSFVRIFFMRENQADFSIENVISKSISAGESETYLSIDTFDKKSHYLLEFGTQSSKITVSEISIILL